MPAADARAKTKRVVRALGARRGRVAARSAAPLQKIAFGTLTVMNAVYNDKAIGDAALRASDLDYTIVQPVTFSEKPATGRVTLTDVADLKPLRGFPKVPRADVAETLVAIAGGTRVVAQDRRRHAR